MLLERLKTAVVAVIAILLLLFLLPATAAVPVIALVIAAGAWEWAALIGLRSVASRLAYVLLIAAVCVLTLPALGVIPAKVLLLAAGIWWLCALGLVLKYPVSAAKWLVFIAGIMVLAPAFFALLALLRYPATGTITGQTLLLFVLAVIWGADIGGYFAGRFLGKRKLAPAVSPKKTWAGVVGGLVFSALIGLAGSAYFGLAWFRLVPLCIVTAAVSVLGDLTVSLFKREAGIKDSGSLFPGHGGMLDRLDSIAAGTPLFVAGIVAGHGAW